MKQITYTTKQIAEEFGMDEEELLIKLQELDLVDEFGLPTESAIENGLAIKLVKIDIE
jgi:hypothetical protein